MDISGIGSSITSAFGAGTKKPPTQPLLGGAAGCADPAAASASSPLDDILKDYDLTSITPSQLTEMLDRLKSADVISAPEHQQLSQLRTELDSQGIKPDEPFDLLGYLANKLKQQQDQLAEAQRSGDSAQLASVAASLGLTKDQSGWLSKLQAARNERPTGGLNAQV